MKEANHHFYRWHYFIYDHIISTLLVLTLIINDQNKDIHIDSAIADHLPTIYLLKHPHSRW
jgi:hypothetical protein